MGQIANTKLSANFNLHDLLKSNSAARDAKLNNLQYNPPAKIVDSLTHLTLTTLQPIRSGLGVPVFVNSGYRSPELNGVVPGSSTTSQHCLGEAADIEINQMPVPEVVKYVKDQVKAITGKVLRANVSPNFILFAYVCLNMDKLDIDQVIHEYGDAGMPNWVHTSSSKDKNKRQILRASHAANGKPQYVALSLREALSLGT